MGPNQLLSYPPTMPNAYSTTPATMTNVYSTTPGKVILVKKKITLKKKNYFFKRSPNYSKFFNIDAIYKSKFFNIYTIYDSKFFNINAILQLKASSTSMPFINGMSPLIN